MNISKEKAFSVMESLFFMSSEPRPFSDLENLFKGELSSEELKKLLEEFKTSYNQAHRGLSLEKTKKGWLLITKSENKKHLLRIKPQSIFRLSRPSLEVLSIIAFEQPCAKIHIDEIRGVESAHLLRTLMDKELICPSGKSDLPGKPSTYKTTNRFLEVFGFESLKQLPSQQEIEELLPDTPKGNDNNLKSISELFNQKNIATSLEDDEKENQKIKNNLKKLPSTVEFLKSCTSEQKEK